MDPKLIFEQFHDHLAPKLDTYEQAIYLYLLRHSRLQEIEEIVVGFKSARRRMAFGIGEKGKPMAEGTCYDKLRSLESKGCIKLVASEREGTRLRLQLPSEIPGLVSSPIPATAMTLDRMDFFGVPENRLAILQREAGRCFYCQRAVNQANYVIEHIVSRPEGNGSYRNVVAACRECNNRKGAAAADDFLRDLYRRGLLNSNELQARIEALGRLLAGELKPTINESETARSGFTV